MVKAKVGIVTRLSFVASYLGFVLVAENPWETVGVICSPQKLGVSEPGVLSLAPSPAAMRLACLWDIWSEIFAETFLLFLFHLPCH